MTYPQLNLEAYDGTTAIIHTNHGDMTVKLFDELAPKTVKNFVELSKKDTTMVLFSTVLSKTS